MCVRFHTNAAWLPARPHSFGGAPACCDHGALVILERAHGALGGPIQLLGACRRPAQLLPVLGAERLQRLVDELRAAVRVQALDRAAELRLRLANKDGDVVRDLVLAPQLGVPHVAGVHVLHHQAVLHDHAAIALHLHLVRVHVHALARLGAAVQAAVPKGCPRRLALDARRALTNARLCRLDAAAAHALQVDAVVEHPAAVAACASCASSRDGPSSRAGAPARPRPRRRSPRRPPL